MAACEAIVGNHLNILKTILNRGIEKRDVDSLLNIALIHGYVDIINLLSERKELGI